jgi:hypothetical protein
VFGSTRPGVPGSLIASGLIVAAKANRMGPRRWSPASLLGAGLAEGGRIALILLPLRFAIASPGLAGANAAAAFMGQSGSYTEARPP